MIWGLKNICTNICDMQKKKFLLATSVCISHAHIEKVGGVHVMFSDSILEGVSLWCV